MKLAWITRWNPGQWNVLSKEQRGEGRRREDEEMKKEEIKGQRDVVVHICNLSPVEVEVQISPELEATLCGIVSLISSASN